MCMKNGSFVFSFFDKKEDEKMGLQKSVYNRIKIGHLKVTVTAKRLDDRA